MNDREIRIEIPTEDGERLEGRLILATSERFAVICHPHPLYGGDMDNNVVLAARDALTELGVGAVRFNFRSVGASTGQFGRGEGEAIDIASVCQYLNEHHRPEEIHAVAYSFGTFAFLKAIGRGLQVKSAALVSPPATAVDLSGLALPRAPCLVVVGDRDSYCERSDLDKWLESRPRSDFEPRKVVLKDTDHFYWGSEKALQQVLEEFFAG